MGNIKYIAEDLLGFTSEEVKKLAKVLKEDYGIEANHTDIRSGYKDPRRMALSLVKGWNGKLSSIISYNEL